MKNITKSTLAEEDQRAAKDFAKKEQRKREKIERKERKKAKKEAKRKALDKHNGGNTCQIEPLESTKRKKRRHEDEDTSLHKESSGPQSSSSKPPSSEQQPSENSLIKSRHPFSVDEADHCETPERAYRDILPVLDQIATACGKTRATLQIYDPYYCDGGIHRKLKRLGCHCVINENRDFYRDIETKKIPPHDVILTNPPYSGNHMESLLKFASTNYRKEESSSRTEKEKKKHKHNYVKESPSPLVPFLLLLPHYVYTKNYFGTYFDSDARGTSSSDSKNNISTNRQLFYLVPKDNHRYNYEPPSWVSHETGSTALARGKTQTAPFPSFWYCHVPSLMKASSSENDKPKWLTQTFGQSGQYHLHASSNNKSSNSSIRLHYANCTCHLPREFKGEFDVTNKRPNPRARKRAAKKKFHQNNNRSSSFQPQNGQRLHTQLSATKTKKKKRY